MPDERGNLTSKEVLEGWLQRLVVLGVDAHASQPTPRPKLTLIRGGKDG